MSFAEELLQHIKWLDRNSRGSRFALKELEGADLSDEDLRSADLSGANLRGANFRDTDLRGADLIGSCFSNAALTTAKRK